MSTTPEQLAEQRQINYLLKFIDFCNELKQPDPPYGIETIARLYIEEACQQSVVPKEYYVKVSVDSKERPPFDEDILVSYDNGQTFPESAAYRENRTCMLAGVGGGNGYFGEGFCTNGSTGCESGLILPDVTHWLKKVSLPSSVVPTGIKEGAEIIGTFKYDHEKQTETYFDRLTGKTYVNGEEQSLPVQPVSKEQGGYYYALFKFFSEQHGLTLVDLEIQDIINAVDAFNNHSK